MKVKICFISNYFNHHQKELSDSFYALTEGEYAFVATGNMRKERQELGYGNWEQPDYVINTTAGEAYAEKADRAIAGSQILIIGSTPLSYYEKYLKSDKLIFRYCERPFKKRSLYWKLPYYIFKWRRTYAGTNHYLLCAGAYTYRDYRKAGLYKNRGLKWGYFPAVKRYDTESLFKDKEKKEILWCGRFLDWKHPEYAIRLARKLKENNDSFRLTFIGTGEMENELIRMAKEAGISDRVRFLGSMPPEEVRLHMEKAGIYLFTSDRREGWGAVLNESMNSGCAVVAMRTIGSVPFLVRHGENGMIVDPGNEDALYQNVRYLLAHPDEQERLGQNAYKTVTEEWNAEIAAERFLRVSERILAGEKYPDLYEDGPCSTMK